MQILYWQFGSHLDPSNSAFAYIEYTRLFPFTPNSKSFGDLPTLNKSGKTMQTVGTYQFECMPFPRLHADIVCFN